MTNNLTETSDKLFPRVIGNEELRESILLQLVGEMKILFISDYGTGVSLLLNPIKENFSYVKVIEDFNDYISKNPFPTGSILARASPKQGRFNPEVMISEQVEIPAKILNQFDVIFIMRDIPDRERDRATAESIFVKKESEKLPNLEDLKKEIEKKRNIVVSWNEQAKKKLVNFYVNLRNEPYVSKMPPIPISPKMLNHIKNMCESYAKLKDSQEVSMKDVERSLDLFRFYMGQVSEEDEDLDKLSKGKGRNIRILKRVIEDLENKFGKLILMEHIEDACRDKMTKKEIRETIELFVRAGDLERPRKGFVRRTSDE